MFKKKLGWLAAMVIGTALVMGQGCPAPGPGPDPDPDVPGGLQAGQERVFAGITFVYCPAGTFTMGSNREQAQADETPHQVTLTKGFWIGKYEVTQAQWEEVMENNPSLGRNQGPNRPVDSVSWNDVQAYIAALNEDSGENFRLPTEAEWEYACRAGSTTEYTFGNDPGDFRSSFKPLADYAWFEANSATEADGEHISHDVGLKRANRWGIHDMPGNAREWCEDWYGDYPEGAVTDPQGPETGQYRVERGGAAWHFAQFLRSARRSYDSPGRTRDDRGFRLVRPE